MSVGAFPSTKAINHANSLLPCSQETGEIWVREKQSPIETHTFVFSLAVSSKSLVCLVLHMLPINALVPKMSPRFVGDVLPNASLSNAIVFGAVFVSSNTLSSGSCTAAAMLLDMLMSTRCHQKFVSYWSIVFAYRLFLHPYAKYPGPKIAAVSELWYAYHWYDHQHHKHKRLPWSCMVSSPFGRLGLPVVIRGLSKRPSRSMETSSGSRPARSLSFGRKRKGVCYSTMLVPQRVLPLTALTTIPRYPHGWSKGPTAFYQNRAATHPRATCRDCGRP